MQGHAQAFVPGPYQQDELGQEGVCYTNAWQLLRDRRASSTSDIVTLIAEQAFARELAERQRDYLEAALEALQTSLAETLAAVRKDKASRPAVADLSRWPKG